MTCSSVTSLAVKQTLSSTTMEISAPFMGCFKRNTSKGEQEESQQRFTSYMKEWAASVKTDKTLSLKAATTELALKKHRWWNNIAPSKAQHAFYPVEWEKFFRAILVEPRTVGFRQAPFQANHIMQTTQINYNFLELKQWWTHQGGQHKTLPKQVVQATLLITAGEHWQMRIRLRWRLDRLW